MNPNRRANDHPDDIAMAVCAAHIDAHKQSAAPAPQPVSHGVAAHNATAAEQLRSPRVGRV